MGVCGNPFCGFSKARWAAFCAIHGAGSFHTLRAALEETHPASTLRQWLSERTPAYSEATTGPLCRRCDDAFLAFSQYSNAQTWMSVLEQLDALHPTTIVPSHGPIGDGSLIGQQRGVLDGLQARVRALRMEGLGGRGREASHG